MLAPALQQKRLDFLDVARGSAAMLILLEHGLHHCVPAYHHFSMANIVIGQAGILVFFMISGFVIPMSLEIGRSNATFWIRRFFRLFPVYWFSIGLAFAYLYVGGPLQIGVQLSDAKTWLANLALFQGVLKRPNVWGVFWSLHFEVALYCICSVLFACGLLHRIGAKTSAALLVGFALDCAAKLLITGKPAEHVYLRLIVLAALSGLLAQRYVAGRIARGTFYGLLSGVFAVVVLTWLVNLLLDPTATTFGVFISYVVIVAVAYGGFVGLLEARGRNLPRVACWLGRRSYPLYLVHPFVLLVLIPTGWPVWVFMPCLVGFSLLLAELTHRIIERPGIALGRLLEKRPIIAGPASVSPVVTQRAA
jgi:peptidoglycan/LPS O-acetylase OafA/YrhL